MKDSLYLIISFFIIFDISLSQNKNNNHYDSLKQKADALWEERKFYESADYYIIASEYELQKSNPDYFKVSDSYGNAGYCYDDLGKYEKAIDLYEIALKYARIINDSSQISTLNSNIAQSYFKLGKYDLATQFLNNSLVIDKALNNKEGMATNYNALGKIYEIWGRYKDAIQFYSLSLKLDKELGNETKISIRLSSLASVYKTIGNYDIALKYQKEALEIEKKLGNIFKLAVRSDQIGEIYQFKREYKLAEKYFFDAINLLKRVEGNKENHSKTYETHAIIYNHIGKNFSLMNDFQNAKKYYNYSLKISNRIKHNSILLKNYKELSELYRSLNDYKSALKYLALYSNLKDSAFNERSEKVIQEFREKYESEKKEKEIAILTKEKELNELNIKKSAEEKNFIIIFLILFVLLTILTYNKYSLKKRTNKILENKNKELENINSVKNKFFTIISHDLKSPISSFQKITETLNNSLDQIDRSMLKEFIKDMNDTATKINELLKNLLKWSMSQSGKLAPKKEIININEICEKEISLQQSLAKEKDITISLKSDSNISVFADRSMISMAIRNILNNAVKFSNSLSEVLISCSSIDGNAKISITNSGIGINPNDVEKLLRIDTNHSTIGNHPSKGSGLGIILTQELLRINNGKIIIDNYKPEETTFSILLPIYN